MFRFALVALLALSCGKVENGKNGVNGAPGLNGGSYYSYEFNVSIQQIIEEPLQEVIISDGDYYQLPSEFQLTVDNSYPNCELQDLDLVIETPTEDFIYTFQSTENRYQMQYKSGPLAKYVDSSTLKVYYKSKPEVDCGDVVYRLHSGLQFKIRVFKEILLEE